MAVLRRFLYNIAIADVVAIFHQIRVKLSDCNSQRILWTDASKGNSNVETYR